VIDVAIIGGGPAGSAAAIACARAGLATLLFERRARQEAEHGIESIGPECASFLHALGAGSAGVVAPFAGIATAGIAARFGNGLTRAGFHLCRAGLDDALRRAASEAGTDVRVGAEVLGLEPGCPGFVLHTAAGPVAARFLIDATGRRRWLGRRLGLARRRLSPPLIAWRDVISSEEACTGAFARFTPGADGWTWLAELSPGRAVRIRLRRAGGRTNAVPDFERAVPYVASWHVGRVLAGPGWWIAGEAAAALDPASGSGILFALRSGTAAGRAATACASKPAIAALISARYHDALSRHAESQAEALSYHYRRLGIGVLDQRHN
jgi:flavin-dependent dehydrogenase